MKKPLYLLLLCAAAACNKDFISTVPIAGTYTVTNAEYGGGTCGEQSCGDPNGMLFDVLIAGTDGNYVADTEEGDIATQQKGNTLLWSDTAQANSDDCDATVTDDVDFTFNATGFTGSVVTTISGTCDGTAVDCTCNFALTADRQ